jgi:hypothetical protein
VRKQQKEKVKPREGQGSVDSRSRTDKARARANESPSRSSVSGSSERGARVGVPAGTVRKDDGSVVFPSSVRPDGSVRKERRVKPGFLPPDQVPRYETVPARVSRFLVSCSGTSGT